VFPTQITLRNLRPSQDLSVRIRDLCEKLTHLNSRILTCRVSVEQPLARPRTAPQFLVEVQVRLPGQELGSEPQLDAELDAAIRKAFLLVRRQLRAASTPNLAPSSVDAKRNSTQN
jgi:hypothetical protein